LKFKQSETPNAVAAVFGSEQLTYQQLNYRANQLAHHLQKLGVGPEVLVGVFVERSLEMMVGLLGILKAGGAYVPLEPAYPKERLAFMLSDSQVSVLLTQEKLLTGLPEQGALAICLDTGWGLISQESEENLNSGVNAANLAYIIYTSGSTGKPKGTMIVHQGLVNYLSWCIKTYAVADGVGSPVHSSIGFDATITSLFSPLLVGQRVVFLPEKQEIEALSAVLCSQSNFSLVKITPAHLALLSELLPSKQAAGQTRALIIGGEALSKKSISFWQTHAPETRLINEYGPTETVVGCCVYEVPAQTTLSGLVPIGRPIANTQLYILDRSLQPVPIGVTGELHIGGDGLARGYLNQTDLTTQKFIPNPFSNQPGERLYKTGDLARYLPDGNIEFLGRIDNQVKIRGFRIELGEIEAVLGQHPAIDETVVMVREDVPGDKRLVAYVVVNQATAPTVSQLHQFLKQKLPEYMIPSAIVKLEALPLTPNGKVDRRALLALDTARAELQSAFVVPRDTLELQLAHIWEDVLNVRPIGVTDNFFTLGGHSLLAVRLLAQIEKAFGKNLPLATLFQSPTIEQLAKILHQSGWSLDDSSEPKKSTTFVEYQTNFLNQERLSALQSSLVPIQPHGLKPPLFCVHVLGRGLKFYLPLAHHFDLEQPLYGLAAQMLDKKYAPPNRVEDLAAHYIKEMRILQPDGPYFLAGLSFGGLVAFEIAQQLVAQGQQVALLALLDTYAPGAVKQLLARERISAHWNNFLQIGPTYILEKTIENVKGKIQRFNYQLNHSLKKICCKFYLSIGQPLPDNLQNFTFEEENQEAANNYVPQAYPGRVTLFRGMDEIAGVSYYRDPLLGWGELAVGGLEIHEVPNTHLGMLQEPHVQVLAEKLKACIDRV
jgi:aspartate racemase